MTTTVTLPAAHHATTAATLAGPAALSVRSDAPRSRDVYAAVHVVADPLRACADLTVPQIDWTPRCGCAMTCGHSASASPNPWTPPSAVWG